MTPSILSRSLTAACLCVFALAACQTTAVAPEAASLAPGAAVDSREGGTARLQVAAALSARGVLYVRSEIHTLELALARRSGTLETPVASVTLRSDELTRTVTFDHLKQQTSYRLRAIARLADGTTVISDPSASMLDFSVGGEVAIAQAVPVRLIDTVRPDQAVTGSLSVIDGVTTTPTTTIALRPLAVSGVQLSFDGDVATVGWQSTGSARVHYDMALVNALDATDRLAFPASVAEGGTSHQRALPMGTRPSAHYRAEVVVRGKAEAVASQAVAYTRPNAISDVTLSFDGTTATVSFHTLSPEPYDYDVMLTDASGASFDNSDATDATGTSGHVQTLEMTGRPSGTYTAKVVVKNTAVHATSAPAAYTAPSTDSGGAIPGGGDPGSGGSTVF